MEIHAALGLLPLGFPCLSCTPGVFQIKAFLWRQSAFLWTWGAWCSLRPKDQSPHVSPEPPGSVRHQRVGSAPQSSNLVMDGNSVGQEAELSGYRAWVAHGISESQGSVRPGPAQQKEPSRHLPATLLDIPHTWLRPKGLSVPLEHSLEDKLCKLHVEGRAVALSTPEAAGSTPSPIDGMGMWLSPGERDLNTPGVQRVVFGHFPCPLSPINRPVDRVPHFVGSEESRRGQELLGGHSTWAE